MMNNKPDENSANNKSMIQLYNGNMANNNGSCGGSFGGSILNNIKKNIGANDLSSFYSNLLNKNQSYNSINNNHVRVGSNIIPLANMGSVYHNINFLNRNNQKEHNKPNNSTLSFSNFNANPNQPPPQFFEKTSKNSPHKQQMHQQKQ